MDKREQIIKAAMQILVDKGIQATPMSAIATAAGTGMGTIYHYFATKEDLINAIYLYVKKTEITAIISQSSKGATIQEQFLNYYTAFVDYYLAHPISFVFIGQIHNLPIIKEETKQEGKKSFAPILALLKKGQKEQIIKRTDTEALLHFLSGSITTYVNWCLKKGKKKVNYKTHLQIIWDAIKK